MNIQEIQEKFKGFWNNTEYLLTILIVCVSLSSFWLGRVSVKEQAENVPKMQSATVVTGGSNTESNDTGKAENGVTEVKSGTPVEGGYVASKSGTKYHLPWCGSAKQIKEENKIWFATKEEAEKAGYTPASNCKGI